MKGKMTPAEVTAYGVQPSLPVESALHVAAVLEAAAAELVVVVATEDEDPELVGVAEVDTTMGGTKVSLGVLEARAKRTEGKKDRPEEEETELADPDEEELAFDELETFELVLDTAEDEAAGGWRD